MRRHTGIVLALCAVRLATPAEAQRALRAATGQQLSRAHPFFWAPFAFVGD
jgi:CHAT domain-containing protein